MSVGLRLCCYGDGDRRDQHVLTHSFPTRRSSDLDRGHRSLPVARNDALTHRVAGNQSRSSSLIPVLARVLASTRLTITAQYSDGPGVPSGSGLPGREPDRKSVVEGKSVSVRGGCGGWRILKTKIDKPKSNKE